MRKEIKKYYALTDGRYITDLTEYPKAYEEIFEIKTKEIDEETANAIKTLKESGLAVKLYVPILKK